jgi:hypothetical protein
MQSSGCTTNAVSGGDGLIFLMPKKPAEKSQNPLASLNFDFLYPRFLIGFGGRDTRLGLLFIKLIVPTFPIINIDGKKIFLYPTWRGALKCNFCTVGWQLFWILSGENGSNFY